MLTRRMFLGSTAGAAAFLAARRRAYAFGQSPLGITKFAVPLPGLGPTGIPVLTPNKTRFPGTDYYEVEAAQFTQQLHPNIPATTFWGYADAATRNHRYLGGVIVAKRGTPVKMKVTNLLPSRHILPVDPTLVDPVMAGEFGARQDRIAVHLHGGAVTWDNDGGPFHWYSNADPANGGFVHGSSFVNGAEAGAATYNYPNDQSARMMWYHDHAYGLTRINAYAGIATAYLITDDAETLLVKAGVLPNFDGYPLGIPLVIQDKTFWDGGASDPGYSLVVPAGATTGSLWYPHAYEGDRWDISGGTPPPISTVPEFFSDTILVNGAPYPTLGPLPPRRFRFRFLNGSQARFYNLQLYVTDDTPDGITLVNTADQDPEGLPILAPKNQPGPAFIQIGNETGFLPAPALFSKNGANINSNRVIGYKLSSSLGSEDPTNDNVIRYNLVIAPAERPDVIIDFRGFEGKKLILYNDAPAPFPGGDIRNDYFAGGATVPGQGPDTRILMRFEVGTSGAIKELSFAETVAALRTALPVTFALTQPSTDLKPDSHAKVKTLNEDFDTMGRLRQRLGAPEASDYLASALTDVAQNGEVQQWEIYNLTGDTHPMHFHLVNVNIVKREQWAFDSQGNPKLPLRPIHSTARPPDANEQGWKETVRMNPGEVVTVNMKFTMPKGAPPSPRLQAMYGINGAEYVWHCHILEHEEHDMMHALVVI